MSSPKYSINLLVFTRCFHQLASFKPLCTKKYVPSNGRESLCKNLFLPCSVWLYLLTINRALYETIFYGAQAVGAGESHEISHTLSVPCTSQSRSQGLSYYHHPGASGERPKHKLATRLPRQTKSLVGIPCSEGFVARRGLSRWST